MKKRRKNVWRPLDDIIRELDDLIEDLRQKEEMEYAKKPGREHLGIVRRKLEDRLEKALKHEEYEEAARIRDVLKGIK